VFPIFAFVPVYDLTTPQFLPRGGGEFDWHLGDKANSLSLTWTSDVGIDSGQFAFAAPMVEALEWIERGLGLHIEVWNRRGQVIWDGFVNELSFSIGGLSLKVGPLVDIANQVGVSYTPIISADTDPITTGVQTETVLAVDGASQTRYGVFERWYAANPGTCFSTVATYQRDRMLRDVAWPKPAQSIDFLSGDAIQITASLLGYYHRLKYVVYENATSGTVTLSTKIAAVLDADSNGMFSSANAVISTNAFLVNQQDAENRTSEAIIREMVEIGDPTTDDKWLFQVHPGRFVTYGIAPLASTPTYQRSIYAQTGTVELYGQGVSIDPWDVWPGNWLYQPDANNGAMPAVNREADLRYMFIEQVKYDAPWSVGVSGEYQSTIPQMIAKANLEL